MSIVHHEGGCPEGERRRDLVLARLAAWRPVLIRRFCRGWLRHLLDRGPDTSDGGRSFVIIPDGTDPRLIGAAVRSLAIARIISRVDRRPSRRPEAHARTIDVWAISDRAAAESWLIANPELPEPDADRGSATQVPVGLLGTPQDLFTHLGPAAGSGV